MIISHNYSYVGVDIDYLVSLYKQFNENKYNIQQLHRRITEHLS